MPVTTPDTPAARVRRARTAACLEFLLLLALGWQILQGCHTARTAASPTAPVPAPVAVDLMRDPAWRLALLPGIGTQRAWDIVRDRRREPPYTCLADLARIRGIGPGTIKRLAGTQTVRVWLDGQPVRCRDGPDRRIDNAR